MESKLLLILAFAIGLSIAFIAGYYTGTTQQTEQIQYTEFQVLQNCTITAIEQNPETTTVWFTTQTPTNLTTIKVDGRHFSKTEETQQTYTFYAAKNSLEQWKLIHYTTKTEEEN